MTTPSCRTVTLKPEFYNENHQQYTAPDEEAVAADANDVQIADSEMEFILEYMKLMVGACWNKDTNIRNCNLHETPMMFVLL